MNNLSNLNPVQVDTLYLERLHVKSLAVVNVERAQSRVFLHAKWHYEHSREWFLHPDTQIERTTRATLDELRHDSITATALVSLLIERGTGEREVAALESAEEALSVAVAACREVEDEYESRPWSRYWLVTSSDGHIHRSTNCCTCNKGRNLTGFALAAYLSGKSDVDAVADLGPALCSICFPEAPVESKEQARISARLALTLAERGCDAFLKAREQAAEKAREKAANLCPGSGEAGVGTEKGSPFWHACPSCGEASRKTSSGKIRSHRRPYYFIENRDNLAWTPGGWAPRKKAYLLTSIGEARAIAAGIPGASVHRK